MPKLYLLRHLKSQWNFEDRFAGWSDVPLSRDGINDARRVAAILKDIKIDKIYTSPLVRNIDTVLRVFEGSEPYPIFFNLDNQKTFKKQQFPKNNAKYIPVFVSEKLNERDYGELEGHYREEIKKQYGEEQFNLWRRSFSAKPPKGESLKDTFKRTVPFYKKFIENDLKKESNILITGSHNSLRSLVKYIENISDEGIANREIDYGGIIKYEFVIGNKPLSLKLLKKELLQ